MGLRSFHEYLSQLHPRQHLTGDTVVWAVEFYMIEEADDDQAG